MFAVWNRHFIWRTVIFRIFISFYFVLSGNLNNYIVYLYSNTATTPSPRCQSVKMEKNAILKNDKKVVKKIRRKFKIQITYRSKYFYPLNRNHN